MADRSGDVEVLVLSSRIHHAHCYTSCQIACICIMSPLLTRAQNVKRILSFQHLLHQVRHNMRHRQLDVAAQDLGIGFGSLLSDAHCVERSNDCVWEPMLLPGSLGKVFAGQLLEAVGAHRRRTFLQVRLLRGEGLGGLVDHGAADHNHLLQEASLKSLHADIECGACDALILREQEVGQLVEHRYAPNDSRSGHKDLYLVVKDHFAHQVYVLGIALEEVETWMFIEATTNFSVLPKVVYPVDLMTLLKEHWNSVAHYEAMASSDKDAFRCSSVTTRGR
mmetsp:Transcript_54379/g.100446  ORF Transcript_54379/g.100446 Transcript_54379/m.100446 type:complete len:279 (-) Transcript_54379:77-913(-)